MNVPFDGLFTLAERLRVIGERLPNTACSSALLPDEAEGFADRAAVRGVGPSFGDSRAAMTRDHTTQEWHRRQAEILQRMDENLRRLRELVESRAAAPAVLLADPA